MILRSKKLGRLFRLLAKTSRIMMNKKAWLHNQTSRITTMTTNLSKSKRCLWSITVELAEETVILINTTFQLKHQVF